MFDHQTVAIRILEALNERRNTQSSGSSGAVPLVCEGVCIVTIRFDVEEILSFDCFLDSSKSYRHKRSEFSRWSCQPRQNGLRIQPKGLIVPFKINEV